LKNITQVIDISLPKKTKVELQEKKRMLELAENGRNLLEDRLGTLLEAFSRHAREILATRQDLTKCAQAAFKWLILVKSFDKHLLDRISLLSLKKRGVIVRAENIQGVQVPIIQPVTETDTPIPFCLTTERIAQMIEAFDTQIDLIIELATKENTLMRLGREIKKSRTQYNALEQILIPELTKQIHEIESSLEEKERNELYKLRLFLKKKELQAEPRIDDRIRASTT